MWQTGLEVGKRTARTDLCASLPNFILFLPSQSLPFPQIIF